MNQVRLWNDPAVRAERQAAAEKYMGRRMEFGPGCEDDLPMPEGFIDELRRLDAEREQAERTKETTL